ncbi:amidohydrolase family protein [Kitasatospora sp. NPDC058170]|uniref:amidohydrolase family protein n=1 Tax=Kitasatospora sp. NPDC058170 TaxID=3346364 RepID=UPI0036DC9AE5
MTPAVVDAHVHLWDPGRFDYPWLTEPALRRAVGPDELAAAAGEPIGVVVVEAGRRPEQAGAELDWVRARAAHRPELLGMVAHLSLEQPESPEQAEDLPERIRRLAADPFVVGVRRLLQDEPAGFTAGTGLRAGVALLGDSGLPFDACVREHQLAELDELAAACPQTVLVLDHLGKPRPGAPDDGGWRRALRRLAARPNVVCKLSGLATEALPGRATPELLRPYLHTALDLFGPDRCLYGSDWPVMTLAGRYRDWLDLVRAELSALPASDAQAVLGGNALRVYGLTGRTA